MGRRSTRRSRFSGFVTMVALIVFGGLPGSGKSSIARELARETGAMWLRIDSIEQPIRESGVVAVWIAQSSDFRAFSLSSIGGRAPLRAARAH